MRTAVVRRGWAAVLLTCALLTPFLAGPPSAGALPGHCEQRGCRPLQTPYPPHKMCGRWQHRFVHSATGWYVVKNDNFQGYQECIVNYLRKPDFTITKSTDRFGGVEAFPFVFTGCSHGLCSRDRSLPAPVTSLRRPEATWLANLRARGTWNAALELWFDAKPIKAGQATGAELMIWLGTRNLPLSSTQVVHIDGARWYLAHWISHDRFGHSWRYIQFRRIVQKDKVRHLRLIRFIHRAEHAGWISKRWYLLNVEAGFEIWSGGQRLATRWFSFRMRHTHHHVRIF